MRYKVILILSFIFFAGNGYGFTDRAGRLLDNSFWHNNKSYISLGVNYFDENFDPFDFIEDELDSIYSGAAMGPGEMKGVNLSLYKNISPYLSGKIRVKNDRYDFNWDKLKTDTYSGELNFIKKKGNLSLAVSIGAEYIKAEDLNMDNPNAINYMIKKIAPSANVKLVKDPDGYWIDMGDGLLIRSPDSSKDVVPAVKIYDSGSLSYYGGVSIHYKWEKVYSGLFAEYGQSRIDSKIDTTVDDFLGSLKDYLTENQKEKLEAFPYDFERDEAFISAGAYLQFPLFFKVEGNFSFAYIWLDRKSEIDYEPENYVVDISFLYPVTKKISLNFGGKYLYRQLNGVVPFLYNKYTQTTFDHKYGYLQAGISYTF